MDAKQEKAARRKRLRASQEEIPWYVMPKESCSMCKQGNQECIVTLDGTGICTGCAYDSFEPTTDELQAELESMIDDREDNLMHLMWERGRDDGGDKKPN